MPQPSKRAHTNTFTITFVIALSFGCALVLSILANALREPQQTAKELDRSEQMLLAARILNNAGYFQIKDEQGQYLPAKHLKEGILIPTDKKIAATADEVLTVYQRRIRPFLIDEKGNATTFEKENIDEHEYTSEHKKLGTAHLPLKLAYEITNNPDIEGPTTTKIEGYVIPIAGYGLWDAIYGYLAIEPNGNTIIGTSWYEHKETPGLGAIISAASWTKQFPGKQIFLQDPSGDIDKKIAPLGIIVVRGKVAETLGDSPKVSSAVDGIAGATLTGNGVTKAYKETLAPYRPFFIRLQQPSGA